ncbi:DUF4124 domain-containing protein [Luteibacter sp. NPDC031894]|uniref:DUF4124 domain-containing protein n=1 Tax=Luteibacter sp. NPDC031894 TaxID=3390572 RepID=UPI003D082F2E
MKMTSLFAIILVSAMAPGAATAQSTSVYKWTDASGTVHYTDQPPQGRAATRVTLKGGAQAVAPAAPAPIATDMTKLDAAEAAATRRNCEAAKANLATLSSGAMLVDSTDPSASRRLRPDEIEAARRSAQAEVVTSCGAGAK